MSNMAKIYIPEDVLYYLKLVGFDKFVYSNIDKVVFRTDLSTGGLAFIGSRPRLVHIKLRSPPVNNTAWKQLTAISNATTYVHEAAHHYRWENYHDRGEYAPKCYEWRFLRALQPLIEPQGKIRIVIHRTWWGGFKGCSLLIV